jgi:hypothetical protein
MRVIASVPAHAAGVLTQPAGLSISAVPLDLGTYAVSVLCRREVADDPAIRWLISIVRDAFGKSIAVDGASLS